MVIYKRGKVIIGNQKKKKKNLVLYLPLLRRYNGHIPLEKVIIQKRVIKKGHHEIIIFNSSGFSIEEFIAVYNEKVLYS